MTTARLDLTCEEFLDLAAGLVLDALDPAEVERVEQHARRCTECTHRLAEFRATATALGSAVPQVEPPPGLLVRIREAARTTPQQRPSHGVVHRLRRPRFAPAWLVAAASLVISLATLSRLVVLQGQISTLQSDAAAARAQADRYQRVVEVLASDRLAIRPLQPVVQTMPGRGMVYMDPSSGTGMLMCHHLPPIAAGHAYQVWFVRGTERVSAGLLWPDYTGSGYAVIQVPTDLQSFDSIGLTDEPGTGSLWPTSPRVIGTQIN